MAAINTEKIFSILDKGDIQEQIKAFHEIKEHISKNVSLAQQQAEDKANELQNTLQKINGNY